jgi:hypothetical protein
MNSIRWEGEGDRKYADEEESHASLLGSFPLWSVVRRDIEHYFGMHAFNGGHYHWLRTEFSLGELSSSRNGFIIFFLNK